MIYEYDLREAQRDIQRAYDRRSRLVRQARREGWTDQEIGEAMGLTRMAVWKIRHQSTTKGET